MTNNYLVIITDEGAVIIRDEGEGVFTKTGTFKLDPKDRGAFAAGIDAVAPIIASLGGSVTVTNANTFFTVQKIGETIQDHWNHPPR